MCAAERHCAVGGIFGSSSLQFGLSFAIEFPGWCGILVDISGLTHLGCTVYSLMAVAFC